MGLWKHLGLTAVLLVATASQSASPIDALLSDPVAAAAYDYPALRDRLGLAEFVRLSQDTQAAIEAAKARRPYPCDTVGEAWVRMGLFGALTTPDVAIQRADWKKATDAVEQSHAERTRLKSTGEDGTEVRSALAQADQASDPRLKILFRRYAEDQATRLSWSPVWKMSGQARTIAFSVLAAENCAVDGANAAWLKREIIEHGWFDSARYGANAASAAFLIVQHADNDPAFQRSVLPLIAKDPDPGVRSSLAMLTDRVAKSDRRPQVYGTQGSCKGPGVWEMDPVENPEGLDQRRAAFGLPPMAIYKPRVAQQCG